MFCLSISPLSVLCVMVILVIKTDSFAQPAKSKHLPNLLSASSSSRERKPNIILILTDDQDVELGSLNYMPKTLKAIRYQGAEFRHAYVTTPMCCPSRSSLLTGMYVHNHNVYTNNDNCSNTQWQATYETRSFATYLSNAGYRTGYFGKYLNKYNGSYIPPGWREWGGLIMNSKYYNYSINMNGKKIKHGFDYHKDYYPDLIANDSIAFLRQSKKNSAHKPVMLTMSFPSPHGPEDSAPQYSNLFFNVTSHHIPSYDYAPNPDKQWILQVTNKMQPIHKEFTDLLMTKRLQTLQSVDSAVQRVVEELEDLKELENTYIIYTSDHGYHLGQFGLVKGKSFPFEFDVRVPFLVRGPGVEAGTVVDEIVLNIDLAPTFLDMAGVEVPPHMDGRSVLPLFLTGNRKRLKWPDTFLIESSGRRETPFLDAKLRRLTTTPPITASEYQSTPNTQTNVSTSSISFESTTLPHTSAPKINESEEDHSTTERMYDVDLESDEGARSDEELDLERIESEQADQNVPILDRNQMQIDNSVLPGFISTKIERLSKECSQADMQKPCSENQKWYCENENGRWRKHKCKSIVIPHTLIDNRSFKKCTCRTSHGDIIRKIPVENINKRYSRLNGRFKRRGPSNLASEDREVKELHLLLRNKRASISRVDHMLNNVRDQIRELEVSTTSAIENLENVNFETNTIHGVKTGCSIIDNGRVNCPNQIYHDRKVWQKSRHEVNNEIHDLKNKLEQLKEIRKHLKFFRPNEDYNALNSTSNENLNWPRRNSFHVHHGNASQFYKSHRKKHRRPFHYDTNQGRHRQIQNNTFSNNATVALDIQNVNSSKLNSNNTAEMSNIIHHRHTHFQQELTTQGYEIKKPSEASPRSFITTRYPKARISPIIPFPLKDCHCEHIDDIKPLDEREIARESKRKLKEEKLKKKQRRQKKKDHMEKECSAERMNCFHQDNDHWKTAPLWTNGPFCFCMNANNNTYSCIRTINSTHNFLYCEFTTGLVTFYNLRIDPFELENRADQLKLEEKTYLHTLLHNLIACRGKSCTVTNPSISSRNRANSSTLSVSPHHRYRKKKLPIHLRNKSLDAGKMLNVSIQTTQDLPNHNESNYTEIDGRIVTSNGATTESSSEN